MYFFLTRRKAGKHPPSIAHGLISVYPRILHRIAIILCARHASRRQEKKRRQNDHLQFHFSITIWLGSLALVSRMRVVTCPPVRRQLSSILRMSCDRADDIRQ
jgi:hypothetical protein